jgi:hypothetical protein
LDPTALLLVETSPHKLFSALFDPRRLLVENPEVLARGRNGGCIKPSDYVQIIKIYGQSEEG